MRRLSIRVRLTLAFAVAMAIVLAAVGAFLYLRLGSELERALEDSLRTRSDTVAVLLADTDSIEETGAGLPVANEGVTQLVGADGNVIVERPNVGAEVLLTDEQLARAQERALFVDRGPVSREIDDSQRILARPVETPEGTVTVIVAAPLEERDDALSSLLTQLLIIGPIALVVASALGYLLATAALRPVESMRRRAAEISGADLHRRLPVSEPHDEIARLGETLNEMLDRLEVSIERERRFVSDASHELRTPIALLRAELELALSRSRTPDELQAALRSAHEETERLSLLVNDLLVLARSDEKGLPVTLGETPIGELVGRVAERFRPRAAADGREIQVNADDAPMLVADELRLEQALGNLVDNALRHGEGTVSIEATTEAADLELHVLDEGPGFPEEFLASAFRRFSRADEARARGGTGLGLAIVEVVAQAHGGGASAANRPEGGADVWLTLPLDERVDDPPRADPGTPAGQPAPGAG